MYRVYLNFKLLSLCMFPWKYYKRGVIWKFAEILKIFSESTRNVDSHCDEFEYWKLDVWLFLCDFIELWMSGLNDKIV